MKNGVLRLPVKLRPSLKKPLDCLYCGTGTDAMREMAKDMGCSSKVITVGDMTTYYAMEAGITPDIAIVDEKTKRKRIPKDIIDALRQAESDHIEVDNPPATITSGLVKAIKEALERDCMMRIFVHGEEDLAALPAVMLAPQGSIVIYGQPDEGAVMIHVTDEKKREISKLLREMTYEGSSNYIDMILKEE